MNYINWVNFLKNRKLINLLLLFVYYLLVVLPHEQVGLLTVKIFGGFERDTYNLIVLVISLSFLAVAVITLAKKMLIHSQKKLILFYLLSTIGFATLCVNILFVVNIEVVHFFQYAMFALLCYPLTLNYNQTMLLSTLAGALDEAYQYFYLAPQRTDYFDFNDVVINLIGVAFGLIIIKIYKPLSNAISFKQFFSSPAFILLLLTSVVICIAIITNVLGVYHTNIEAQFILVKKAFSSFWITVHPNITYHVMLPFEGLFVTIGLWLFYYPLGKENKFA